MAELRHHFEILGWEPTSKPATPRVIERRMDALEERILRLENLMGRILRQESSNTTSGGTSSADAEVAEDPFERWLREPSIEQYRGKHVAIHPIRGVVAHADSVKAVIAELRTQGVSLDDIALDVVPMRP